MDIKNILELLQEQVLLQLKAGEADLVPFLKKDVETFLKSSEEKITRWTQLLAEGSLTREDYEWLLHSQKDLIQLKALQVQGISKIKLHRIKNAILNTLIDLVFKALPI
ncbi:MAG: hypothetical protein ACK4UK_02165 [Flavobacterium sp.]